MLLSKQKQGFTIVELLIVIVVIAILAMISIVAYNGIQNRAYDTSVEADIATVTKKLEIIKVDLGRYPQITGEFSGFKFNKTAYDTTDNNIFYCVDKPNDKYAFGFVSKSKKGYLLVNGVVSAGVTVNPTSTCNAISKTWTNDATTVTILGYFGPPTSAWSGWSWTN